MDKVDFRASIMSIPSTSSTLSTPPMLEAESTLTCPYCGARFTTVIDQSTGSYETIEDCQACCHPMVVRVFIKSGEIESIEVDRA
jgi:hypothetical protein